MGQYVQADASLPRSLDVQISISKSQAETRTNLSVLCVVGSSLGFLPDANRVRFYSSLAALAVDFPSGEIYNAGNTFFAQSPRPVQMAVGEEFSTAQPGLLVAGAMAAADFTTLAAITTGSMKVTVGATATDVTGMNFTGVTTLAGAQTVIQAALTSAGVAATCSVRTFPGGAQRLVLTTTGTGSTATLAYTIAAATGVYAGTALKMTLATGASALAGYTPTGIAGELSNILSAANAAGSNIYGWCLAASLRVAATQEAAAAWAAGQTAFMPLVTNDVAALDPSVTTDIGSVISKTTNKRARCIYHSDATLYPDVSILAYMLAVDYQVQDATVTAKFAKLPGISTVSLTETQWSTLQGKGYDTYVTVGNSSITYRDGGTEDPSYWMDSTINLDNFVEDLSVNILNVFLRNKKVPYTRRGQMMLVDAARNTGEQYIFNGTFADRETASSSSKSGAVTLPGVQVIPTPITSMSNSDRQNRIGPPIKLICQEAGAIHSVAVSVEVVS